MRLFHPLSPGLLSVHILIDFFFIFGFWITPRSAQVLLLVLPSEIILGRLKGTLSDAEDGTRQGKRPVSCAVTLAPIDYFFPVGGYWLEIWGLGVSAFLRLIWKSTRVEKKKHVLFVCLLFSLLLETTLKCQPAAYISAAFPTTTRRPLPATLPSFSDLLFLGFTHFCACSSGGIIWKLHSRSEVVTDSFFGSPQPGQAPSSSWVFLFFRQLLLSQLRSELHF